MLLRKTQASDILIYSDSHYGHQNIIEYCNRPFQNVLAMDRKMIDFHNQHVRPKDTVIHLGDFAYGVRSRKAIEIFEQLNGKFIFIIGNHDSKNFIRYLKNSKKVMLIDTMAYIKYSYDPLQPDFKILLSHFPYESWDPQKATIHLHGHAHGVSRTIFNRADVGVDATKFYYPIPIHQLLRINKIFPFNQ